MYYIVPCNLKYYDVFNAFHSLKKLDWKQRSKNVKIGDIVYVYVSSPVCEICFKCIVRAINKPVSTIDDSAFYNDSNVFENFGRYMELEMLEQYEKKLPMSLLHSFGIKGNIFSVRAISDSQAELIEQAVQGA